MIKIADDALSNYISRIISGDKGKEFARFCDCGEDVSNPDWCYCPFCGEEIF